MFSYFQYLMKYQFKKFTGLFPAGVGIPSFYGTNISIVFKLSINIESFFLISFQHSHQQCRFGRKRKTGKAERWAAQNKSIKNTILNSHRLYRINVNE